MTGLTKFNEQLDLKPPHKYHFKVTAEPRTDGVAGGRFKCYNSLNRCEV